MKRPYEGLHERTLRRRATSIVFMVAMLVAGGGCSRGRDGGSPGFRQEAGPRSSPTVEPSPEPQTIAQRCKSLPSVQSADLDGDRRDDRVYRVGAHPAADSRFAEIQEWEPRIGACTASGVNDEIPVKGQGEVFRVGDLDGDGRSEVWAGGTSGAAGHANVYRLVRDRLRVVMFGRYELELTGGYQGSDPQQRVSVWGCSDVAGDSRREVVVVTTEWRFDHPTWRVRVLALDGLRAVQLRETSGEIEADDRTSDSEDRLSFAESLIPGMNSC